MWKKMMKKILAIGIAALMLSMIVMSATAMNDSSTLRDMDTYMISVDKANIYATWTLQYFVATNITEFDKWEGATVGEPMLIYDTTGDPVLYDVPIVINGDIVGVIGVWAKKNMGVPVYSLSSSPPELTTTKVEEIALKRAEEEGAEVGSVNVVYYDFPKRAVEVTLEKDGKVVDMVLVDQATSEAISENKIKPFSSKVDKKKAQHALELWKEVDEQITAESKGEVSPLGIEQELLDVTLYGQETTYYCAPASAQMILSYHGYQYTQSQIAEAMGTTTSGTPTGNIPTGIEEVTNNQVDAWNDWSWGWGTVTNEINNNHPYMSNIAGHARAVRGYYYDTERPWIKYQRINDPWPVGQGEDRWENYYTVVELCLTIVHP
ncbi:hypothetical protein C5S30_03650 [ANME-1 cluster archaeon GoMg4]|nr:hypothetical protein [ANME-1 cluster archaeon GoMg4]